VPKWHPPLELVGPFWPGLKERYNGSSKIASHLVWGICHLPIVVEDRAQVSKFLHILKRCAEGCESTPSLRFLTIETAAALIWTNYRSSGPSPCPHVRGLEGLCSLPRPLYFCGWHRVRTSFPPS